MEREILNHKRLIHPHIVQLKEVFIIFVHAIRRGMNCSLLLLEGDSADVD